MPDILDNEMASAIYVGKATQAFCNKIGAGLTAFINGASKAFNVGSVLQGITSTATTAIKGIKAILSGNWGAILSYIEKNPFKAIATAAAVIGGALIAVGVGIVIVQGTVALGALVGGAIGLSGFVGTLSGIGILAGLLTGLNHLLDNPIGGCISWMANGALFLYNYDFNISQSEMNNQVQQAIIQIAGSAGGVAGFLLADLACGALPGGLLLKLNVTTAHRLWEIIGEPDKQALVASLTGLLATVGNLVNTLLFNHVFNNLRKVVQTFASNPYGAQILNAINPGFADVVKTLGKETPVLDAKGQPVKDANGQPTFKKVNNEPFILSQKVQNRIQEIKNPVEKAFVQAAYQNAFQSCTQQLLCLSFVV
jgi:hypothetical protein